MLTYILLNCPLIKPLMLLLDRLVVMLVVGLMRGMSPFDLSDALLYDLSSL